MGRRGGGKFFPSSSHVHRSEAPRYAPVNLCEIRSLAQRSFSMMRMSASPLEDTTLTCTGQNQDLFPCNVLRCRPNPDDHRHLEWQCACHLVQSLVAVFKRPASRSQGCMMQKLFAPPWKLQVAAYISHLDPAPEFSQQWHASILIELTSISHEIS